MQVRVFLVHIQVKPKPGAEIIKIMTEIYEDFRAKPHVVACHAGLEMWNYWSELSQNGNGKFRPHD